MAGFLLSGMLPVLGASSPAYPPVPPAERLVGLAYTTWHTSEDWRERGWGTPELGFYRSDDRRVIRQHGEWLADAGVDFVFVDWSNNVNFDPAKRRTPGVFNMIEDATTALFEEWSQIEGAPKICIMAGVTGHPAAVHDGRLQAKVDQIHQQYLARPEFCRMYQEHDGKPLLILYVNTPSPFQKGVPTWKDPRFTVRWMTGYIAQQPALYDNARQISKYGFWSWEERGDQSYTVHQGRPEAMTVVASWRDHDKGQQPPAWSTGGRRGGETFRQRFARAGQIGVKLALVVSWNEWTHGEQPSAEFSKDLEPSREHGRFYLQLLKEEIARFKGRPKGTDLALQTRSDSALHSSATETRPNVLFILADDLSRSDMGCYGGTNVKTPNMDRLAQEGMRFTHASASIAMCAPLRASLYTGLYPARHGVFRNREAELKVGTFTVAHGLGALGYRVGLTGKRHLKPEAAYPFTWVDGFDPRGVGPTADYTLDGIQEFMTQDASQPFCLFVCSTLPHAPWTVGDATRFDPAKLVLPPHWVDTPETRRAYAKYLAEVAALDSQVGDVLATLDRAGLRDNTLVFFASEQGAQFPGAKWTLYAYGVDVGLLARWPGQIKAGSVSPALVQYEDVLPTLLDLAGGKPPGDLDGRSFLPVLLGQKHAYRDVAFGIHNNFPEGEPYPIRSIRTATHRLILNLDAERDYTLKHIMDTQGSYWHSWVAAAATNALSAVSLQRIIKHPPVELYDLQNDPWELRNLAGQPELALLRQQLEARLRDWMRQQQDPGAAMDVEFPYPPARAAGRPAPVQPNPRP
jgi:N-sulfoglucosamine sulfohydrolase